MLRNQVNLWKTLFWIHVIINMNEMGWIIWLKNGFSRVLIKLHVLGQCSCNFLLHFEMWCAPEYNIARSVVIWQKNLWLLYLPKYFCHVRFSPPMYLQSISYLLLNILKMLFSSVQNLGWMVKLQEQNTNEVISEEIEKKIECKRRTSSVVEKKGF